MKSSDKYVLVFRRFEIENGMRRPQNVRELWTLLRARKQLKYLQVIVNSKFRADFFHAKYFPGGHYIPGLMDWLYFSTENESVVATNEEYKQVLIFLAII